MKKAEKILGTISYSLKVLVLFVFVIGNSDRINNARTELDVLQSIAFMILFFVIVYYIKAVEKQ